MLDARWSRPVRPRARQAGRRRARSGVWTARQVPAAGLDRRPNAGHAPADDRQPGPGRAGRRYSIPREGRRLYEGERSTSERYLRARSSSTTAARSGSPIRAASARPFLIDDDRSRRASSELGVEPLSPEFTSELLGDVAAGRTAPLKSFLLDQSRIAGVGNIYADEALYRARLHPLSPAGSMRPSTAWRCVTRSSPRWRPGSTAAAASIDDYRDGRGKRATMQERVSRPHPRRVSRARLAAARSSGSSSSGRSTYFCPSCQR